MNFAGPDTRQNATRLATREDSAAVTQWGCGYPIRRQPARASASSHDAIDCSPLSAVPIDGNRDFFLSWSGTMQADTFLVIARFPMDDVVIECKTDLESAKELARVIVAEPDVLRGNVGESFSLWFGGSKLQPNIEDLHSVGILRLLGGVVSLGFVEIIEAN